MFVINTFNFLTKTPEVYHLLLISGMRNYCSHSQVFSILSYNRFQVSVTYTKCENPIRKIAKIKGFDSAHNNWPHQLFDAIPL